MLANPDQSQGAAVPEFAAVQLVIDHLVADAAPGQYVQKTVFTTETVDEALLSLIRYYDLGDVMLNASSFDVVRRARNGEDNVYVLITPENVQVVGSVEMWDKMVWDADFGQGSYLQASMRLTAAVALHMRAFQENEGPLSILEFTRQERPQQDPEERTYTQAEVDELMAKLQSPKPRTYTRKAKARR